MATNRFIEECKSRANGNRLGQLIVDELETPITNSDNLQNLSIDSGCYVDGSIIGTVYSKCLKASFVSNIANLTDKNIYAQIGVKYADLSDEYISMGKYKVERPNNEITVNMSQITAYDGLYTKLDDKYVCNIDYSKGNIVLRDIYIDVCNQLKLIPVSTSFINDNIPIKDNPFTSGEKNRTVLQTIAKISCSFIDIDNDTNKISLCWLSQNSESDYIFHKNDYVKVEGGQVVCGPINCLIIKNSVIDDENVTIKDEESIKQYGEHSITISEDYILYSAELRQQAITSIWNRVHGLKYIDCKLTTYYGKPFLKLGNKIRVYTSDTEYFDTYVLKHNFTYDGTFASIIESPALTEQEVKTKQNAKLGDLLKNTQIIVDKQNQTIKSVVNQTNEQNQKISEITQTVNELNSKIGDIADITVSAEDTDAKVELNEINESEPVRLVVRPIGEDISNLLISSNMLISDKFKLKQRVIRFTNTKTNKNFDYPLPDDLLYYDSENYDEFILDYDGQSCVVNKKVAYNTDGTKRLLDKMETVPYKYPKIVLSEGDYVVSILGYDTGYIFARLMSKNIYTTQFYTKAEVDSEISQSAQDVTISVNKKLTNYSTTTEMNTQIKATATDITNSVSETYTTKETTNKLSSKVTQNSTSITSEVKRATDAENNLSSKITQTDSSLTSEITARTNGDNTLSSRISQNATNITAEVNRATGAESGLNASIQLKLDTSKLVTQLNASADVINIKGNRFILDSTNCKVLQDGTIKATNGEFSGKITATSGEIGGCLIEGGVLKIPTANITGTFSASSISGGSINASNKLTIGGFSIDNYSLYGSTTENYTMRIRRGSNASVDLPANGGRLMLGSTKKNGVALTTASTLVISDSYEHVDTGHELATIGIRAIYGHVRIASNDTVNINAPTIIFNGSVGKTDYIDVRDADGSTKLRLSFKNGLYTGYTKI